MNTGIKTFTKYKGMTLLEILISVVVLSVGLLGIASMLLVSNKANNSSYAKLQAVQAAYDMFDRIRANSKVALTGSYNVSNIGSNGYPTSVSTPAVLCNSSICTPAQLAQYDSWYWLTKIVSALPSGSGSVTTALAGGAGNTVVTVTVQWNDAQAQAVVGSSSTQAPTANFVRFTVQSQI
ncbi:type IV pilus modification protein PilV [Legionella waltersii]|uniref:Type IV fimbrial biogenesis protein PilV n=1 Tax=Legionella waltersii TaxID=66969 RepID=A0A0W1A044_9GAMM|nr:type IV pilus modification protein PilV [Legionella waltersii]KTD74717.1 type IV fimbrial biogenesis protein PilV [Legionella waltersii]SNV00026.1 type IV fimbrial biogenesis protein PilV [Legionella waltersii]